MRLQFSALCPQLIKPYFLSQRRTFFTNPLQILTAKRTISHPAGPIYALIADIPSYPSFLPYCTSAATISLSGLDPVFKKRWPRTADMHVAWGPIETCFRSRVYCLPNNIVEAVAGKARCSISPEKLPHYPSDGWGSNADPYSAQASTDDGAGGSIFTSLLTRWTLREYPFKPPLADGTPAQEGEANKPSILKTEVALVIEVQFASAAYAALSQAAAPKVADMMIDAFEKRAKKMLSVGKAGEFRGS